jgi:hypothetical protein
MKKLFPRDRLGRLLVAYFVMSIAVMYFAGILSAKHRPANVRQISSDLSSAQESIALAERQMPAGSLATVQLDMARQRLFSAQQHLAELPQCEQNK